MVETGNLRTDQLQNQCDEDGKEIGYKLKIRDIFMNPIL